MSDIPVIGHKYIQFENDDPITVTDINSEYIFYAYNKTEYQITHQKWIEKKYKDVTHAK